MTRMTVADLNALVDRLTEMGVPHSTEVFVGCPDSAIAKVAPEPVEPIVSVSYYNGDGLRPDFICLDITDHDHPVTMSIASTIAKLKR